jgi:arsenite methyltransferase
MKAEQLKGIVKETYGAIARQSILEQSGCCGSQGCCGEVDFSMIGDEYLHVAGYNPEADLGLGCGLPTQFAAIKAGDHVLDLGCGAGNDCFVAHSLTGETGHVTGLDFSEEMLERAERNRAKKGYKNISFVQGDIEKMPLADDSFDVVISNCVLNLVPEKEKAFAEIFRVLKPGGHFCISDIVLDGVLPEPLKSDAELYAGCVSGAIEKEEYLEIVKKQGFTDVEIRKEKLIAIPGSILERYMSSGEIEDFRLSGAGTISITLTGYK